MKRFCRGILLGLGMSLSGCSSYEAEFDCPTGVGLPCASLSEVNRQIDEGILPRVVTPLGPCGAPGGAAPRELGGTASCRGDNKGANKGVVFYYPKQELASGEVIPARTVLRGRE